ncbi:putative snare domain-containing protein [Phaeoacremonium minimum UCRPA7]|uniref:Putative snare domain-containing protein n=1 Tax=Phaeoacremonium minimum (strain UCR-PA7) TaxID=1286976 RepID=R8BT96_PHAM7|nr:putative snare domain-containing protein [Phaeoacremonium minimum UCRPA7]EOO02623.1 putative snare domain-containing protein [Phaeoacremonium minimum UCRPA7]
MSYSQYSGNPYQQGPSQESGYGYGNPYGQQEQHEMQPYGQPYDQQPAAAPAVHVLSQQDFLSRVSHVRSEIRSLTADVQQIAGLHQRALAGSDPQAQQQLDGLVASTQLKNTSIRDQIRSLKADVERTTDGSAGLKKRQFDALNNDFKKELQGYLQEEQQYKERYRDQIARQYRIVNPDATETEVREAADRDWGNEGIFQTALRTNRTGQASAVLGAVRARHNELQKIEQSITELAGLFQDLDTLVVQQEPTVIRAEEQTEQTNQHLQKGNEQVAVGITHARRARKLKWWCALVVLLIVIAIALGVALGLTVGKNATSK